MDRALTAPIVRTCFYYGNGYPASGHLVKLYDVSPAATSYANAWYGTTGAKRTLALKVGWM